MKGRLSLLIDAAGLSCCPSPSTPLDAARGGSVCLECFLVYYHTWIALVATAGGRQAQPTPPREEPQAGVLEMPRPILVLALYLTGWAALVALPHPGPQFPCAGYGTCYLG